MTGRITPRQFHEAGGVEDWRVLGEGACAYFRTGGFAGGARLVRAIGELAGLDDHHPDVDVRGGGVTVRLITVTPDYYGLSERDVELDDQAEARIAAALAAGGRLVSDRHAPSWWTLADAEGNEVDVATWRIRD